MHKGVWSVIAVLALLAAGTWYLVSYLSKVPLSDAEDVAIRSFVADFGTKLQFVPLLATSTEVRASMQAYYGNYISPELIGAWAKDTSLALGRTTSSPWPASIQIGTVRKTSPDSYTVEGTVIEVISTKVATGTEFAPAAAYPVNLELKRQSGETLQFRIVAVKRGELSTLPHEMSLVGKWDCAPLKQDQENNGECVRGLTTDDGFYIVEVGLLSSTTGAFADGETLAIEGMFVSAESLNTDRWQKYDAKGILSASSITPVN